MRILLIGLFLAGCGCGSTDSTVPDAEVDSGAEAAADADQDGGAEAPPPVELDAGDES